jgi:hypothetical protein
MLRRILLAGMGIITIGPICMAAAQPLANAQATSGSHSGACEVATPAEIAKATGLTVGDGTAGPPIPGVIGKCTWSGSGDMKVIVTLADAQHMQLTVASQEHTGGTVVPDLGSKAVGVKGAGFTGGGYIVSVLDAKGGFGVSILGKDGTPERTIALAKLVESHR